MKVMRLVDYFYFVRFEQTLSKRHQSLWKPNENMGMQGISAVKYIGIFLQFFLRAMKRK